MIPIQLTLTALSIFLLTLSLWAKVSLRKNRLSRILFPLALLYNFLLGCLHLYFFETGQIPVIGAVDNPILAAFSLLMVCAFAYAIPWAWLNEPKFDLNRPNDTEKKLALLISVIEQLLHYLKISLVILASALFYSVILIALASQITPLNAVEDTYYAIGCALLYLTLVGIGVILYRFHDKKKLDISKSKAIK